jgi:alkylation response protein AidB-like acyl-CoA dehydrogenase
VTAAGIDLRDSPPQAAFRGQARDWLRANVPSPPLASGDTRDGFAQHVSWERALFDAGWSVVSWPRRFGGRDASMWEWLIFEEEYYAAGAPQRITQNGIFLLAPALFEFGTDDQRERILPRMAAATDLWCQGWSEPEAGSDLAAITSVAQRVRSGWRLSGQKPWTTRGAFCTHLFGLFRTGASAERHRDLTYFLLPLDGPGITVRGFGRLDGDEGFAEVFFDNAFVPDETELGSCVLGEVGQGWQVAMATAGSERGLTLRSPGRYLATAQRLVDLAAERDASPRLRERVTAAWLSARAYQLFTLAQVGDMAVGRSPGARASLAKLGWSELDIELHETALELLGPQAEQHSAWSRGYLFALAGPIYAGTNEIQRNIIAERLLGLPRA